MSLIELRTDPTRKELAWFGLLLAAYAGVVGLVLWRITGALTVPGYVWGAGAALAMIYYATSPLRRPMFVGWMYAAYPIGWVVSHVLLAIVYFVVLTPIGLLMRLIGYDPMTRRLEPEAASYWTPRERPIEPIRYFRQF